MAGTLNVTTISGASTITGVTTLNAASGVLATQNGMTGIAKAWVNFDGTGTPAIRGSFNVSSITDNGTGDYTVNFTTAMPNANYVVAGSAAKQNGGDTASNMRVLSRNGATAQTTSAVRVGVYYANGAMEDAELVLVAIFSS